MVEWRGSKLCSGPRVAAFPEVARHSSPELFWIWAVQYWARSAQRGLDPIPRLRNAFVEVGLSDGTDDRLVHLFSWWNALVLNGSFGSYEFGCLRCGTVGVAERVSLCAISLSQCQEEALLQRLLARVGLTEGNGASDVMTIIDSISSKWGDLGMVAPIRPEYLQFFLGIPESADELINEEQCVH